MSAASEALGLYGWNAQEKALMSEVEDWTPVVHLEDGGGYDWTTFLAFWSPTARRFYWISGSGCSCNSISDLVRTVGDFGDGERDAVARALDAFAADAYVSAESLVKAQAALREWIEPRT